jgi:hypothetical protein
MRMPKGFNKWSASEQEAWLVKKLQEFHALENEVKKVLGKLRGGESISFNEIDRFDEFELKS